MNIKENCIKFVRHIMKVFGVEEKFDMQSWAEREIEIACKRERAGNDNPDGKEWDYGCACYDSALKAYKSLIRDGHSGCSIGMTQHILNRLIECKPLTPIEDTPDIWNDISDISGLRGEKVNYQCKRMSSLFKYVYADGTIKYKDVNSAYCIDIDNGLTYHSSLVQRLMDEMFPISMPYMPTAPTIVHASDLLTDRIHGDFDTVAIFYAVKPDGSKVEINKFFKEGPIDWIAIDEAEYKERQEQAAFRIKCEKENMTCTPDSISKKFNKPDRTMRTVGPEIDYEKDI